MGVVLFSFGDIEYETGNKLKGIAYIDESLKWCDSLGALSLKQDILKGRIHVATEMGNYKEAFLLQQEYEQIEDSLKNDETKETIKKIEKMNLEKIQILDKLEKEKKRSGGGLFDKLLKKTTEFIKDDMNVSDEDYIKP